MQATIELGERKKYYEKGVQHYVGIQKLEQKMFRLKVIGFSKNEFEKLMEQNPKLQITELLFFECTFSELPKLPDFRDIYITKCTGLRKLGTLYFKARKLLIDNCPKLMRLPTKLEVEDLHIYDTPICFLPDVRLKVLYTLNTYIGELDFGKIEKIVLLEPKYFNQVMLEQTLNQEFGFCFKIVRLFNKVPTHFTDILFTTQF